MYIGTGYTSAASSRRSFDGSAILLSELKKLDPVAYLRFASVYRSFGDPKDFAKELRTL